MAPSQPFAPHSPDRALPLRLIPSTHGGKKAEEVIDAIYQFWLGFPLGIG